VKLNIFGVCLSARCNDRCNRARQHNCELHQHLSARFDFTIRWRAGNRYIMGAALGKRPGRFTEENFDLT
jgi:hypothetical protein